MNTRLTLTGIMRDLVRGLREPRFYAVAVVALLLWVAAYQYKRDYTVEVADRIYQPYIAGFNDIELSVTDPPFKYRWSEGEPQIAFPGIGNEPVQVDITTIGSRPNGPPPRIEWSARGQSFELQTLAEEHTETFFLDRGSAPLDGDLRLALRVPTFTTASDPREHGVIIRRVVVRPADYGLRPPVVPSIGTLGALLVGLAGLYLLVLFSGLRRSVALATAWLTALLGTLGMLMARPDTAILAASLPSLFAWTLLLALLARLGLSYFRAGEEDKIASSRPDFALPVLAFALAFLLRFGGLTYPQFLTSDIILHVHNAQDVLRGNWVFTEQLPDGRAVPYPPAYYVLIAALSPITGTSDEGLGLALKWTSSLLDALTCLALVWAALRIWPRHGYAVGALAALAYLASPGAFDLFSAGNYTNLFGQSLQNVTLLGAAVYLSGNGGSRRVAPALLSVGFFLTMLGHYGMMLATLGIMAIFFIWTLVVTLRKPPAGVDRAWVVLGASGAALGASFAAYYWRFLDVIWGQIADVFGKLGGRQSSQPVSGVQQPGLADGLAKLPGKIVQLSGGLLVILAGFGGGLLSRRVGAARWLLFSWLAATMVFALLDRVVGDSVRWYYLGAAPLALFAARFLASLGVRHRWSRAFVALAIVAALLQMLTFWIDLIYTRYH